MNEILTAMSGGALQHRAATVEAVDVTTRELLVRAAPYASEHNIGADIFESFDVGAFAAAAAEPHRLYARHEHGGPLIGRGFEAEDRADGFWIRARMASTSAAKDALTLVDEKVLTDVSAEFVAQRPHMVVSELSGGKLRIRHKKAIMRGFALVAEGAYGEDAYIAEVRDQRDRDREAARMWLQAFAARNPFV